MKKLFRLNFDCGRMGNVTGVFVADPKDVADAIGKGIYFGEVLGKHSEVSGELDASEVEELNVTDGFVEEFHDRFPDGFGYNPLDYLSEDR